MSFPQVVSAKPISLATIVYGAMIVVQGRACGTGFAGTRCVATGPQSQDSSGFARERFDAACRFVAEVRRVAGGRCLLSRGSASANHPGDVLARLPRARPSCRLVRGTGEGLLQE